ncbi:MAG: hypothetical protein ACPGSM_09585 [Thiolinea sp.]
MELRKIEITEDTLKIGTQTYYAGDIKSFPKDEADEYIRLGWAKCCETGDQGERKPGSQQINVSNVSQQVS